jgi:hypothetical protein
MWMILAYWKQIVGVAILGMIFYAGWNLGSSSVQGRWDKERAATQAELLGIAQKHADMIQTLEIRHDKDAKDIRDYKRTHPDGGLYLPPTPCAGPAGPIGGVQTTAGKESFSGGAQQAINNYTKGVDALTLEADEVVNDCRVVRDYLIKLASPKPEGPDHAATEARF